MCGPTGGVSPVVRKNTSEGGRLGRKGLETGPNWKLTRGACTGSNLLGNAQQERLVQIYPLLKRGRGLSDGNPTMGGRTMIKDKDEVRR